MSAYPMVMDGGGDVEAPYTLIGLLVIEKNNN